MLEHNVNVKLDVHLHLPPGLAESQEAALLQKVLHELSTLHKQGEHIMGQLDDLNAALGNVSTKVDAVASDVATVDAEVKDLIAKLSALPPSVDLTAAIAQAQGVSDRLGAIDSALKAIPPAPAG